MTKEPEIEAYMDLDGCYIESLSKCRKLINSSMLEKIDELIALELDLAIMAAEKAKSEILKKNKEDIVRPIK